MHENADDSTGSRFPRAGGGTRADFQRIKSGCHLTDDVVLTVDGVVILAPRGATVAAAIARAGISRFRISVNGEPRAPLCGMGVCFECRVTINGRKHVRSCQAVCETGMEVSTDA
jgi:predicted molibdopterin-dependent oxidoreductase YjgC